LHAEDAAPETLSRLLFAIDAVLGSSKKKRRFKNKPFSIIHMVAEEKKEDFEEKKVIEKYTPVKVLIVFVVLAIIAFLVINNMRSYEKQVGNILHPKALSGTDQQLIDRALENLDPEYCKNIKEQATKDRCLLISTKGALDNLQQDAIKEVATESKQKILPPQTRKTSAAGEACMLLPVEQQPDCFERILP
jgi:hypothetical protein